MQTKDLDTCQVVVLTDDHSKLKMQPYVVAKTLRTEGDGLTNERVIWSWHATLDEARAALPPYQPLYWQALCYVGIEHWKAVSHRIDYDAENERYVIAGRR